MYGTRTCPAAAETRFSAPHFRHLLSIRVLPCLTVRFLRSNASFTKRSVSSRIACFYISHFLAFCGHFIGRGHTSSFIVSSFRRNQSPSEFQPKPRHTIKPFKTIVFYSLSALPEKPDEGNVSPALKTERPTRLRQPVP